MACMAKQRMAEAVFPDVPGHVFDYSCDFTQNDRICCTYLDFTAYINGFDLGNARILPLYLSG
jgi:hypothetical protein